MLSFSTTSKISLLVGDLVSTDKIDHVPSNYIRAVSERPNLKNVSHNDSIPIIDLTDLHMPNWAHVVKQIGQACQDHGFFQVKNHGVPKSIVSNMKQIAKDFFSLPKEERLKTYLDDPKKTTRLSTSFNIRTEKVANWRDYLRLHCYPIQDYIHEWPTNPESFRDHVAQYCTSAREFCRKVVYTSNN
ncbi:protein DMR6-LIKE OXYGENASE 1-like [Rutidosis leptorrhynchoides]|uniref:protein DMR6-LIKE OXYGENASE 1-like n=1 Tax=Rutidosis leptorrhynchoides TaxID=125765 RepID=UPI003A99E8D6